MGLIRKTASLSTMGLVSWSKPGERAAKYARQTRNAARAQVAQNAMQLEMQRKQLAALDHANVREAMRPSPTPPGWYVDPGYPGQLRWWDGIQWTQHVQVAPPPPPPGNYSR
ncbi:DUF2510 domain-containing protein [Nocardia heshunensis]